MDVWEMLRDEAFWINTAIVVGGTLAGYVILQSLVTFATGRLRKWTGDAHSKVYSIAVAVLASTSKLLLFAIALLIAVKFVELTPRWESMLSHSWFIILALQIALWLDTAMQLWMATLLNETDKRRNPVTITILGMMGRIVIWSMMLLSILANLGINITAMVASLGVGGIAVALAVQTLLSDIFASLSIGLDKPFEIGDFIVFGDVAGTIEHIGLKSTRIASLSGEQIVVANGELLNQIVHNYKRMEQRRVVFMFGIPVATPVDKVRQIGGVVRDIVENVPKTRFDRAHFFKFEDYRLTFEVVYYVLSSDYNEYMDCQQEINLQLMERLAALEVNFALPTQRIEFVGGEWPELTVAALPARQTAGNGNGNGNGEAASPGTPTV